MYSSASRREQAPLSIRNLLSRTFWTSPYLWVRYVAAEVRLLLITPPMTQLNTPYPATAYLTGFLRQHAARLDLEVAQVDASIELFLRVFSRRGVQRILDELTANPEFDPFLTLVAYRDID